MLNATATAIRVQLESLSPLPLEELVQHSLGALGRLWWNECARFLGALGALSSSVRLHVFYELLVRRHRRLRGTPPLTSHTNRSIWRGRLPDQPHHGGGRHPGRSLLIPRAGNEYGHRTNEGSLPAEESDRDSYAATQVRCTPTNFRFSLLSLSLFSRLRGPFRRRSTFVSDQVLAVSPPARIERRRQAHLAARVLLCAEKKFCRLQWLTIRPRELSQECSLQRR